MTGEEEEEDEEDEEEEEEEEEEREEEKEVSNKGRRRPLKGPRVQKGRERERKKVGLPPPSPPAQSPPRPMLPRCCRGNIQVSVRNPPPMVR